MPRRWWNILVRALCSCGMVPTRAERCCFVFTRCIRVSDVRSEADDAYDRNAGSHCSQPRHRETVAGIINLFVDNLFGTGGTEMEQRVLARLKKDFQVGSEDWNDVTFTGPRSRWVKDPQSGSCIEASQQKAVDELEEIPVERNTKEDLHCTLPMHTMYRSLLGQINWLHSGTQFQRCYKNSRCASKAASPTIGDVKVLNKLARPEAELLFFLLAKDDRDNPASRPEWSNCSLVTNNFFLWYATP